MMENDNEIFFRELIHLSNAHKKYNTQKFEELGLTTGQPKVLSILGFNEGLVQKDLAERCMVEPATMTALLNRMEKNGMIRREAKHVSGGKRAIAIFLTEYGRELAEKVNHIVESSDELATAGLSSEEKDFLLRTLQRARMAFEDKMEIEEKERKRILWVQLSSNLI